MEKMVKQLAEKKPEISASINNLLEQKKKMKEAFVVLESKDVVINGKPAKLTVYARGAIAVQFRDIQECNDAIKKLLFS